MERLLRSVALMIGMAALAAAALSGIAAAQPSMAPGPDLAVPELDSPRAALTEESRPLLFPPFEPPTSRLTVTRSTARSDPEAPIPKPAEAPLARQNAAVPPVERKPDSPVRAPSAPRPASPNGDNAAARETRAARAAEPAPELPPPAQRLLSTPPPTGGAAGPSAPTESPPAPRLEAPPTPPPPAEVTGEPRGSGQTAARSAPAEAAPAEGKVASILFPKNSVELSRTAQDKLRTLAQRLQPEQDTRLELRAYARGTEGSASLARRLSLSRALAVRSFLADQGVSPTRIDVRALGNAAQDDPGDRVDIVSTQR
jgi:outer membrane protein OmpA-like peptidoglycan-associated protein